MDLMDRGGDTFIYRGSILFLQASTTYEVKIRVSSDPPDVYLESSITTRSESETVLPVSTKSHFVSPTGTGSLCTEASPCRFRTALALVKPGEEIVLGDGVYYDGDIIMPSGTPDKPIVVRGSRDAIFDGSYETPLTWTQVSGTIWEASLTTQGVDPHVAAVGNPPKRLWYYSNPSEYAQFTSLGAQWPGFVTFMDTNKIQINLMGEPETNPNLADVKVTARTIGINTGSYTFFHGFTMRYYGADMWGKTMHVSWGDNNVVISNMKFFITDSVAFETSGNDTVVQDCEFFDTRNEMQYQFVKDLQCGFETCAVMAYGAMGMGHVIRRNLFDGYFDAVCMSGWSLYGTSLNQDIHDNIIQNNKDDGVALDGWAQNVRMYKNFIHNSNTGISLAPVYEGPAYVIQNIVYNDETHPGLLLKFNHGYSLEGYNHVFHNTFINLAQETYGLAIFWGQWTLIRMKNNVFLNNDYVNVENSRPNLPMEMDYDMFWDMGDYPNFGQWGHAISTFEMFRQVSGQELNGWEIEPTFKDLAGMDLTPLADSPQTDRGVIIPGINDMWFIGAAPDVGAIEYDPTPPVAPVAPMAATPVTSTTPSTSPTGPVSPAHLIQYNWCLAVLAVLLIAMSH